MHEWRIRSDPKYLRKHVYERDLGVCSACGTDTRQVKISVEDAWKGARLKHGAAWRESADWLSALRALRLKPSEAFKSLWQADHIKPVVEGGGECGLEGYRTLCLPCHKDATKELAGRRARAPRPSSRR